MKKHLIIGLISLMSISAFGQSKDTTKEPDKTSDKLDLKKLEDKYWAAKDADFSVVQNRTYTKAGKAFISASYGTLINDTWSTGRMTNFAAGYYFNERWGLELAREMGSLKDNDGVHTVQASGGNPDFNKMKNYTAVNAVWVPFYAKMSVLERAIVYFDMQFALGVGQMNYAIQHSGLEGGAENESAVGYNFDFTQQLFFARHFAFRLDLKNTWSNQKKEKYFSGTGSHVSLGNFTKQDTSFLGGLTYFF